MYHYVDKDHKLFPQTANSALEEYNRLPNDKGHHNLPENRADGTLYSTPVWHYEGVPEGILFNAGYEAASDIDATDQRWMSFMNVGGWQTLRSGNDVEFTCETGMPWINATTSMWLSAKQDGRARMNISETVGIPQMALSTLCGNPTTLEAVWFGLGV